MSGLAMCALRQTRDAHVSKFTVSVRRLVEVNTDPRRRCYQGVHAKSEMVWTEWQHICTYSTREDADGAVACFKAINPGREYKVECVPCSTQD